MVRSLVASHEGMVDVVRLGPDARSSAPADLLIELPHGATTAADYQRLAAQMRSILPRDLIAFFFVNTDVGTPEVGAKLAALLAEPSRHRSLLGDLADQPGRNILVVRSRIPRTLVDCNRTDAPPPGSGLTGMLPGYIRDEADVVLLRQLHSTYLGVARAAWAEVIAAEGRGISLHSYAPRSVAIERVTDTIVADLRDAWRHPESLPLRPEVDVIDLDPEGVQRADPALVDAVIGEFAADGVAAVRSQTYRLHPVAFSAEVAQAAPLVALTVEIRRDLLVDWDPFVEMKVRPSGVDAAAAALARAYLGRGSESVGSAGQTLSFTF